MKLPILLSTATALLTLAFTSNAQAQGAEVRYRVTFDATWSAGTHPGAYPNNAHFSPLIGCNHTSNVRLWQAGTLASNGMEVMAETGNNTPIRGEIDALRNSGEADLRLQGGAPNSPGSTMIEFTTTAQYPLLSLVTMVAPSPDWFVGVDSLSLMENGQWVDRVVLLPAWDAGTDSGPNFTSPNQDTNPQAPITLITGGPFDGNDPLVTLTVERIPVSTSFCVANANSTGLPATLICAGSGDAGDPLLLAAGQVPLNQFGFFLVGTATDSVTPPGSNGVLCLGGSIGRFNALPQIQNSGATGTFSVEIDSGALPLNPTVAAMAGQTFYFQGWFRENGGMSNFTEGAQVTFQ